MNNNLLTGSIPAELETLINLQTFDLCHNHLDTTDPDWGYCQTEFIGDLNFDSDVDGSDLYAFLVSTECFDLEVFAINFGLVK